MIGKLIAAKKSSHWYNQQGQPVFEVPAKSGGMKKTTVVDARELNLVPSVTTILQILDKPAIVIWRISQAIKACLTLQRKSGERISQFIDRIIDRAEEKSTIAVGFGRSTHEWIEAYTKGLVTPSNELQTAIAKILSQFKDFVNEKSYVGLGVAGTIDITCLDFNGSAVLIDTKTQKSKEGKAFTLYYEHILQLAAYDILKPSERYYILFVSSTEKARVELREISTSEIQKAREIFLKLRDVFYWRNKLNYDKNINDGGK